MLRTSLRLGLRPISLTTLAAVAAGALAAPAGAATSTASVGVTARVPATATASASPIAFGNYFGTQVDATGTVSVTATNGTSYSVGFGAGTGPGATTGARVMSSPAGGPGLRYNVFVDPGRLLLWGNSESSGVSGTGTGAQQTITTYGRIFSGQAPLVGDYGDVLLVTVTY